MSLLHLLISTALAGPWAGIPLDRADTLGLGEPTTSRVAGEWRAPLVGGGLVRVMVLPDEAVAHEVFVAQRASSSTRPPPDLAVADEAAGDEGYRIVRDANVVLVVRDPANDAPAVVERLRAALVTTGCEGTLRTETVDGLTYAWDRCGVLRPPVATGG